jgi:hypothetical protein
VRGGSNPLGTSLEVYMSMSLKFEIDGWVIERNSVNQWTITRLGFEPIVLTHVQMLTFVATLSKLVKMF